MPKSQTVKCAIAMIVIAFGVAEADAADLPPRREAEPSSAVLAPPSWSHFYIASRTGIAIPKETSFTAAGNQVDAEYEIGTFSGAALGYAFGPVFGNFVSPRVELEGSIGKFSVDQLKINGVGQSSDSSFGDLNSITGFASGYIDFNLANAFNMSGWASAIRPYVGAGIGASNVTLKKQGTSAAGILVDSSDTKLAFHVSAGLGIDLNKLGIGRDGLLRNTTLEVGYRHLEVRDLEFVTVDGSASKTDLVSDMVTVGMRRGF